MSNSIIIHTHNKKELAILEELANKMGLSAQILSQSDKEDVALAEVMNKNQAVDSLQLNEAIEYYKTLSKGL